VLIGSFSVAEIAPNLQAFTLALSACSKIYETIDRVPAIDIYSDEGGRPKEVAGNLEFRNINFIYPSRPEVQVLDNVNLFVPHGKTTALVGASGSGKSTIVGLAERWYDPVEGEVLLDGKNLKDLNLRWLRNQISLVSQVSLFRVVTDLRNQRYSMRLSSRMFVMDSSEVNGNMNQRKGNANLSNKLVSRPTQITSFKVCQTSMIPLWEKGRFFFPADKSNVSRLHAQSCRIQRSSSSMRLHLRWILKQKGLFRMHLTKLL